VLEPTIALVSDQNSFREGVVQVLQAQGFLRVTAYCSVEELSRTLLAAPPRLVLVDMDHSAEDPLAMMRELRQHAPRTTVVLIGTALQRGAVHADAEGAREIVEAEAQVLRAVAGLALVTEDGPLGLQPSVEAQRQRKLWSMLTPRQREVLGYLSSGSDNLKIAANLGISERAVKAHVSALLSRFSAENRTELAVLACRAGLRSPLQSLSKAARNPLPRSA
jgi:two-component system, NarL family, nitrate/nitrite response regulator NarL